MNIKATYLHGIDVGEQEAVDCGDLRCGRQLKNFVTDRPDVDIECAR